ncbi:MAG: hypothetical protein IKU17_03545 [Clostridia bacterium]|nr:hypothetical protein [Clostridia bacterium]
MIPNDVLTEELLQQAAAEMATALIDSLPPPDECQHKFSDRFEEKMQALRHPKTICIISPEYISK